jgi:hypothetical protein
MINWSKVVEPTTSIIFWGIEIDSSTMELRLPADKLSLLVYKKIIQVCNYGKTSA